MNETASFQGESGNSTCPRCGRGFVCGMKAGERKCWCAELPASLPVPAEGQGCYCPDCLRELLAAPRANP